jgi:carboxymethylenebutenolidase
VEVCEYLRQELLEEGSYGYLSDAELERRLAVFDGALSGEGALPASDQAGILDAVTVDEHDPSIVIERPSVTSPAGAVDCYVARPAAAPTSEVPGILVIHENRGLTPHIKDVARRYAKLGYATLAPDLLTPKGGADSFSDPAAAIAALGSLERDDMVAQLLASLDELASLEGVDADRLGVTGFCFGGGMTWRVVTKAERVRAAVPFYGSIPALEDVPNIAASVLGIYGGLDERVNAGIPAIEAAMTAAGKSFEKEVYPGAQHAFHNDTNPDRYHPEAAKAAWARATGFFAGHLGLGKVGGSD